MKRKVSNPMDTSMTHPNSPNLSVWVAIEKLATGDHGA
jgi:hypothetical protein